MAAGRACPTMVCSMAAGEPLLQCLEHLLCSFCIDLGVCRVVALTSSHSSIPLQFSIPLLLKDLISEVLPPLLMGLALASTRSCLEPLALAPLDMEEASSSFSQKPPL